MSILSELSTAENLCESAIDDQKKIPQAVALFREATREAFKILPARDAEETAQQLLAEENKNAATLLEMRALLRRLRIIISQLNKGVPLGLPSKEELQRIKQTIMTALDNGLSRFKKTFNQEGLGNVKDTRVFIVGSRNTGYSYDKSRLFAPGRDVDILLVGEGIFDTELLYITLKGLEKDARKFQRKGFIPGFNRRFIPPFLADAGSRIAILFRTGDETEWKEQSEKEALVNFHIAHPSSGEAAQAVTSGKECL